jgi:streptomycin 3"-adenylyltransferase
MSYEILLTDLFDRFKAILSDNLVGIYLHGSYVLGGFNPDVSDIDFLIVVEGDFDFVRKKEIISVLLEFDKYSPAKGFEMSVMTVNETLRPLSPTPFLLHYSNFHKDRYSNEDDYLCSGADDPDLLTHLTVIIDQGICAYGRPIDQVFGIVPRENYLEAIMYDLNDAREGITGSFEYYVLNLCRSLFYLKENVIASKTDGGKWALKHVPNEFLPVVEGALFKYAKNCDSGIVSKEQLQNFMEYMFSVIDELINAK